MKIQPITAYLKLIPPLMLILTMAGCSAGDWERFGDVMDEQRTGRAKTYKDTRFVESDGDIDIVHGVKNNEGYYYLINNGDTYCKAIVYFADKTTRTFTLEPGESTRRMYMSKYNQWEYWNNVTSTDRSAAFNHKFND